MQVTYLDRVNPGNKHVSNTYTHLFEAYSGFTLTFCKIFITMHILLYDISEDGTLRIRDKLYNNG